MVDTPEEIIGLIVGMVLLGGPIALVLIYWLFPDTGTCPIVKKTEYGPWKCENELNHEGNHYHGAYSWKS